MNQLPISIPEWVPPSRNVDSLLLYCPIETKAREMDAKTLLACVAAERGHKAIVGDMVELRGLVPFMPRGVYLSKSIPDKMEKYFKRFKELGYGVTSWCEEGLVFLSREIYKKKMVSVGALAYADIFFAWGENQARAVVEKAPEAGSKIREVGNPRMDLLRRPYREIYRKIAEQRRSQYGEYILFNTNFAAVNNVIGADHAFQDSKKRGKIVTEEDEEHYWRFFKHRRTIFERMADLVGDVSRRYPRTQILVRPHPSENHDTWREATAGLENVEVVYEGTVIPWLLGARTVIHNGCTTALEAYMLETPAIAYRPVVEEGMEFELPNSVSVAARDPEEVAEAIEFVTRKDEEYERWRARAEAHLEGYIADVHGAFSSDRIVDELERYYGDNPVAPESRLYPLFRFGKHRLKQVLRTLRYGANRNDGNRPVDRHRRQKFPDISTDEISEVIAQLRRESGRFEDVTVRPLRGTSRCFVIERS